MGFNEVMLEHWRIQLLIIHSFQVYLQLFFTSRQNLAVGLTEICHAFSWKLKFDFTENFIKWIQNHWDCCLWSFPPGGTMEKPTAAQVVYLAGVSHFVHFGVEAQLPFLPGDSCLCLFNSHLNTTHTPLLMLRVWLTLKPTCNFT